VSWHGWYSGPSPHQVRDAERRRAAACHRGSQGMSFGGTTVEHHTTSCQAEYEATGTRNRDYCRLAP